MCCVGEYGKMFYYGREQYLIQMFLDKVPRSDLEGSLNIPTEFDMKSLSSTLHNFFSLS